MAFDAYFKLDDIDGECSTKGFEKWIELVAYEVGAENSSNVTSKSSGAGAGKASFKKLMLQKQTDKTSPHLFLACCQGTHFKKAKLHVCRAGSNNVPYLTFEFEKLFVASITTKGSETDKAAEEDDYQIESVELAFGKLTWDCKVQEESGKLGGSNQKYWDVTTNTGG